MMKRTRGTSSLASGAVVSSPIRRIFQALLFDLSRVLPHDLARAGIGQPETVQDIIARPLRRTGGLALQLARQEIIGAAKLDHMGISARGRLAALLERAFALERLHHLTIEEAHLAGG